MYSVATLREDLTIVVAFRFANCKEHHTANIVIALFSKQDLAEFRGHQTKEGIFSSHFESKFE